MTQAPAVAQVIAGDLATYGARRCFGLLGTANFRISHALVEHGVELISARHECNATSMADAYAKATQELTLVSVHSGPGLTNALTGIGEAAKSRTPLLVLAGDVPVGAVKSNFHIEQAEMVRSVGAAFERIYSPATARDDALRAVVRALRERHTVVLSLPTDVQDAPFPGYAAPFALPPAPGPLYPDPASVRRLADALGKGQRPLILAGRGAVLSGAETALSVLAERTGALLATTVCGHGLFAGDPWSVGISGGFSSSAAHELISESDLILAFGASLTQWTTKRGKLIMPGAVVAQIDIETARLGYQMPVQLGVHADARTTAEAILAELDACQMGPRTGRRTGETRRRIDEGSNHSAPYHDTSSARFIDPRTVSKAVDSILPRDRVVASDSGHFCGWVPRFLAVPSARASCLSHSFQSVGLGLASAIGLAMANPGALAVLGVGDGGLLMSIADLETAIRLKLRLCILVY
ncbi:MAG: thiamine pyrophosphate-binding protein, partial [Hyphomicrobiaceae bacterium]|nr:thiamine pyrophosphate-binding protein [Hyphomicrobiaceae bacterium]